MAEEIQEDARLPAPGFKLKTSREARHLSIEDVADKLHLRPSVIADLESDVIDHSISMTFTRGYVRLYARYLELEPEPLLAEFDQLANPGKQPAKLQSFSQKVAHQASDARLMMFSYFILFIIIAMAVVWWFQQSGNNTGESTSETSVQQSMTQSETVQEPQAEPEKEEFADTDLLETDSAPYESEEPVVAVPQSETVIADNAQTEQIHAEQIQTTEQPPATTDSTPVSSIPLSETEVTDNNDLALSQADETEQAISQRQQSDVEPVAPDVIDSQNLAVDLAQDQTESNEMPVYDTSAEPVELVFTFTEDCWMNLVDATGEAIAYGIKSAGRVMPVSGIPPFEVKLGAPQAVSLTVAGEPYDMSAFPAGRTATFTIGESSS